MEMSLCMIVKNEEEVLARCLNAARSFIDEIIIVDTGSTDSTQTIAQSFNAIIYDFTWCDDFAKARNYAFSKATKEYIMWLDADDYITKENIDQILHLKSTLSPDVDAISMHYSLGRDEKGHTITSLRRNRIVKRNKQFKWIGRVHEYLEVSGNIYASEIYIHHDKHKDYTDRNLKIYRQMQKENMLFSPRDLYYFANELYYNQLYDEAIGQYMIFLGTDAWVEDKKNATVNLMRCLEATGHDNLKINALLESFKWSKPRADLCCTLAHYFLEKKQFYDAIFWYKVALMCTPDKGSMALDFKHYYTWLPAIQLCVCFSHLEDYYMAYYYNELCNHLQGPTNKVIHNRNFLVEQLKKQGLPIPQFDLHLIDRRYP